MNEVFSLLDEPWIRVRRLDGELSDLGLKDLFAQASSLRRLAGEGPTQDAAVLRLLIAVLHRALPVVGADDEVAEQWGDWWAAGKLPVTDIDAYLERYRGRFDLFGEQPFMQVANLTANKTSGIGKLIADLPDGHAYFTIRAGSELKRLSVAEAARWLVHVQAFDPSGIKTGATGDPNAKGGRGYPIGTGWSGQCGLLMLEGADLRETLLLNLVLPLSVADDRPVWERTAQSAAPDEAHPSPAGPADLLTWPARRVRLIGNHEQIDDVLICNGDKIGLGNRHRMEPHASWRYSGPQSKKLGETVFMPRTHDPERALWRGLPAVLGASSAPAGKLAPNPPVAPVFEWVATLIDIGALRADHPVRVRAVGVEYGPQASTISTIVDDSLAMHADVLCSPELKLVASRAVTDADEAVRALGDLARNLAVASGDADGEGARDRVRQAAYSELDPAYRRWLRSVHGDAALTDRARVWRDHVRDVVRRHGDRAVAGAGAAAWRGRPVRLGVRSIDHLDAGLAGRWFTRALAQALPSSEDDSPTTAQEAR